MAKSFIYSGAFLTYMMKDWIVAIDRYAFFNHPQGFVFAILSKCHFARGFTLVFLFK